MRRWNWQDDRGLSLVEMLIVVAVLALVTGAVFSIFMTSLQAYWKGDVSTQVQQSGRVALDRMTRELRQARRLYSGTQGGFTFNVNGGGNCTNPPQISFVLPHFGNMNLTAADQRTNSTIWVTDANISGAIPYDGSWVSYYLASSPGSATPITPAAPPIPTWLYYLNRTVYNGSTLSTTTIVSNITGLAFTAGAGGGCPTASSRELNVAVTASQAPASQAIPPVSEVVQMDILLRNQ